MRIGTLDVGPNADILLVAEVGLAHDGNCNVAHAFIDAVARTGATVIKFQTHIAEAESTAREPFRAKFSHLDNTRLDYWRRTGFTEEQWRGLKQHAEEAGLVFMSSPFSIEAVDLLERIGVEAWKVGSGETNNRAGCLQLDDPRGSINMYAHPGGSNFGASFRIKPEDGLLIIFPSWLYHSVNTFQSDTTRISISFNSKFSSFQDISKTGAAGA